MTHAKRLSLSAAFFCGVVAFPAIAYDWKPCDDDIAKFCKGAKGDDAISECLEKNEKKVSQECYDHHELFEKQQKSAKKKK